MKFFTLITTFVFSLTTATTLPPPLGSRQEPVSNTSGLQIDLGYSIYEGSLNTTSNLNVWKGIRYASPPIANLRWQSPQPPIQNRSSVIKADGFPNRCPQTIYNNGSPQFNLDFANTPRQSEDCLFLSISAPADAENLPVFFWIHGGGYGGGDGDQDFGEFMGTNNNSFVSVAIQYRLGAFGFLAGDEVNRSGVLNAGIRDQTFALQWVQDYIHLFGGDPRKVTIAGVSAGGGSVMLQAMAFGGELGTSLFQNVIAASPYVPMQHEYNGLVPTQAYNAFAEAVGCLTGNAVGSPSNSQTTFQCLVSKDYAILQNASAIVGGSGPYGTWGGFLPVTDGKYIRKAPSGQLLEKKVNGLRVLSGNNALEGPLFVPQNITTEENLVAYVKETFPLFSDSDVAKTLRYYPGSIEADSATASKYATQGDTGPTANDMSSILNSDWPSTTSEPYDTSNGREAYKYQYSVPAGLHGTDATGYFGPAAQNQGPDLLRAFMTIWGNFITKNNPSISSSIATGAATSNISSLVSSATTQSVTNWPIYTGASPFQLNINQTGGQPFSEVGVTFLGKAINVTESEGPGLRNNFTMVDAFNWEGGRGVRCDFWRAMAPLVPA